jgi:hypothetical protein
MRTLFLLPVLAVSLVLSLGLQTASAQKPKELQWTHAFDLAARKVTEPEFTKDTQKFGVEAFRDNNNSLGVYLSQVGSLGIGEGFQNLVLPLKDSKGPDWITGLDIPARKAGEKEFTKSTTVHSMEIFKDGNTGNWIYVTEKGYLAVAPSGGKAAAGGNKAPKWVHSVDLLCRKGGVKEWKDAQKFGIEVYRDGNTGNLIYICENGAIAAITEGDAKLGDSKAPDWLHGLDLACRKSNEPSFSKDTRKFGVEVFHDITTGNLIFISETGQLAVTAAPKSLKAPTPNVKEPTWTHGLNLKVRKHGEKDFSDKTQVFGAEAFRDENLGVTLYICEIGGIAAMLK